MIQVGDDDISIVNWCVNESFIVIHTNSNLFSGSGSESESSKGSQSRSPSPEHGEASGNEQGNQSR